MPGQIPATGAQHRHQFYPGIMKRTLQTESPPTHLTHVYLMFLNGSFQSVLVTSLQVSNQSKLQRSGSYVLKKDLRHGIDALTTTEAAPVPAAIPDQANHSEIRGPSVAHILSATLVVDNRSPSLQL